MQNRRRRQIGGPYAGGHAEGWVKGWLESADFARIAFIV